MCMFFGGSWVPKTALCLPKVAFSRAHAPATCHPPQFAHPPALAPTDPARLCVASRMGSTNLAAVPIWLSMVTTRTQKRMRVRVRKRIVGCLRPT